MRLLCKEAGVCFMGQKFFLYNVFNLSNHNSSNSNHTTNPKSKFSRCSQHLLDGKYADGWMKVHHKCWFNLFVNLSCCVYSIFYLRSKSLGWVVESSHNVIVAVDVELDIALESDFAATVLGKEDNIADLDVDGADLTVVEDATWTNSNDCALVKLFTLL